MITWKVRRDSRKGDGDGPSSGNVWYLQGGTDRGAWLNDPQRWARLTLRPLSIWQYKQCARYRISLGLLLLTSWTDLFLCSHVICQSCLPWACLLSCLLCSYSITLLSGFIQWNDKKTPQAIEVESRGGKCVYVTWMLMEESHSLRGNIYCFSVLTALLSLNASSYSPFTYRQILEHTVSSHGFSAFCNHLNA